MRNRNYRYFIQNYYYHHFYIWVMRSCLHGKKEIIKQNKMYIFKSETVAERTTGNNYMHVFFRLNRNQFNFYTIKSHT